MGCSTSLTRHEKHDELMKNCYGKFRSPVQHASRECLSADDLAMNAEAHDKVLERYAGKDARGMLVAWESLPHSAPCLTELAVIAHLYAESGNGKAEPLIEQMRNHLPSEAAALQGFSPGG